MEYHMAFDYKKWVIRTEELYMHILKEYDETVSAYFEDAIDHKKMAIRILQTHLTRSGGSLAEELSEQLIDLENELLSEKQRLRRKMMLFVIGDGKSGKSTLVNALIGLGQEVAEIDDLPNTRYIHIYTNEIEKGMVRIRYYNEENEICEEMISQSECLQRIQKEREEIKQNERECKKKIRELSKGKSPEEKEEIERAIYQEFGKSGNIIELFWGLEKSRLLENCNLIDTPGFNQNIDSKYIEKKRNIEALKSHYNQADGILWVLDSQTISGSNTKKLYSQLCEAYEDSKEDMKKNLFYVVNKMDIITTEEDKKRLVEEAGSLYQDLAVNIAYLSAKMAFEGQCDLDDKKIAQSGMDMLLDRISQTFLQRQTGWNLSRIRNNYLRTKQNLINNASQTYDKIEQYRKLFTTKCTLIQNKSQKWERKIENLLCETCEELLQVGKERILAQIDTLGVGSNEERKNRIMYQLFCLDECYDEFEEIYHQKLYWLKRKFDNLDQKVCLSEYAYYKNYDYSDIALPQMEELPDFMVSSVFSYEKEGIGELLSLFGGIGQRVMFWANKSKISDSLIREFELQIRKMKDAIWEQLINYKIERVHRCDLILINSYEKIVGEQKYVNDTQKMIQNSIAAFTEPEKLELHFYEMLMKNA